MGNILWTKTIVVSSILASVSFTWSPGFASSHHSKHLSQAPAPAIDLIITGANNGSLSVDTQPDNDGECGLCYHRELMKKRDSNINKVPLQPFPGD